MFVIGELHGNLSEVVAIQIPEREDRGGLETEDEGKRDKYGKCKEDWERERENETGENEVI